MTSGAGGVREITTMFWAACARCWEMDTLLA